MTQVTSLASAFGASWRSQLTNTVPLWARAVWEGMAWGAETVLLGQLEALLGAYVNLKGKTVSCFTSKVGLFGNCRELQFRTSYGENKHVQRTKERRLFYRRDRESWGLF